jgi:TolB-like protein
MRLVFDDCVLDLDRRELHRGPECVAIAPKAFDLLVYLSRSCERVVTRDDLIEGVWGGRIVSESTVASHINAVRRAIGDDGRQQRVIKTVARKGFRFVADIRESGRANGIDVPATVAAGIAGTTALPAPAAPVLPAGPSIAVLPFVNLSGNPEQEYLADGVVEDIIAALSRHRWLFVVARNSSFTYKGRAADVKRIGQELGVRYVLEGSWRQANHRVRLTGQLIDAATGAHHWAGRFEGVLGDIFELQDRITESVVGAIGPQLERVEIERASRKPTGSLDAYDYYLRGMARLHQGTRQAIGEALPLFLRAIDADADFASAYAMAAWCHCWRKINGWMEHRQSEIAEGIRLARRAVELGREDAVALTRSGHALGHLAGELLGGIELLDRALLLNPNHAPAWFLGAFLRLLYGETEQAMEHLAHAMRLSPLDPELYKMQAGMATAHFFLADFDTAVSWGEKALRGLPDLALALSVVAAGHALSGRSEDARRHMARLRRLSPFLRLSNLTDWLPIHRPENFAILADGLRKAGLPE